MRAFGSVLQECKGLGLDPPPLSRGAKPSIACIHFAETTSPIVPSKVVVPSCLALGRGSQSVAKSVIFDDLEQNLKNAAKNVKICQEPLEIHVSVRELRLSACVLSTCLRAPYTERFAG